MPLPSLEKIIPVFELTIPSTGEVARFRPFIVKEEKLLLIALDGNDEKQMLDAIIQVVDSCSMTLVKADTLANFDLEYIFLQLRAKSVSEVVELAYRCQNPLPCTLEEYVRRYRSQPPDGVDPTMPCEHVVRINLNLNEVQVKTNPEHSKTIMLTDTLGLTMRYPTFAMAKKVATVKRPKAGSQENNIDEALSSMALCVESVFDDESVYSNFELKEVVEWIQGLTQQQFAKLQEFFETMPKLAHDLKFRCDKCDNVDNIHLEGLSNFFG